MTKLLAHGWIRPAAPIVIIPHGTAAEIVNAALDFAPLSGVWVCFCGYSHEECEVVATHVVEAHGEQFDQDYEDFHSGKRTMIYTYSDEALRTIERDSIGEIDYPF